MSEGTYMPWLLVPRVTAALDPDPSNEDLFRKVHYAWRFGAPDEVSRYQSALRDAYHKTAYCMCKKPYPSLAIKAYGDPTRYNVAIFGNTGTQHRDTCAHYSNDYIGDNLNKRYVQAVTVSVDGSADIRLNIPLSRATRPPATPPAAPAAKRPSAATYGSTSLHGALNYLWERARLNTWHPDAKERTPGSVARRFWVSANDVTIGGHPLIDTLITAPPDIAPERFAASLGRAFGNSKRNDRAIFFFATIAANRDDSLVERLDVLATTASLTLVVPDDVLMTAARSYQRQLRYNDGRLVAFTIGFPSARDTITLRAIAILACNDAFIPIDSLYELTVANKLIKQQRTFIKPLRADGAARLPDFVLMDTPGLVEMEVFGRDDPDYRERADAKRKRAIWSWDATTRGPIPRFPDPRRTNA